MSSPKALKDHYSTLGVARTASQDEIKAKYRSLVLKYHPDVNTTEEAQAIFLSLQEAFDALGDEHSRRLYDEEVRIATAPVFRGEPWPSSRNRYARQPQGATRTSPRPPSGANDSRPKYNIAEWERMHYGIGNPPQAQEEERRFWPTGEKEEDLSNHQLYFKYRAERLKKGGGHAWSQKKFSTVSFILMLKRRA